MKRSEHIRKKENVFKAKRTGLVVRNYFLSEANTSDSKKIIVEANMFDSKKIIYEAKRTRSTVRKNFLKRSEQIR